MATHLKSIAKGTPRLGGRIGRRIAGVGLGVLILTASGIAVPLSASASDQNGFIIYFGQNCSGSGASAQRTYRGYNSGESWINDTFDSNLYGNGGLGQKIRNNAASIYVFDARVTVSNGSSSSTFTPTGCVNFEPSLRNHNVSWTVNSL